MGLETFNGNIADLVVTNPTGTDPKSQGDDHIRGIKKTLVDTFGAVTGPYSAEDMPSTPVGTISSTNVQAALAELDASASRGDAFCKNKLFNGEVTRINQRAFDGNWTTKGTWAGGNTIAQQELCYGWDMWAKASATDMVQPIEEGNYRPGTVHTLSGTGVTTQQITSPASGNWNITIPQTARNIQVEEGAVATPFEIRPIGFELAQCQRYYESSIAYNRGYIAAGGALGCTTYFVARKRVVPSVVVLYNGGFNVNPATVPSITTGEALIDALGVTVGNAAMQVDITVSAVI